MEQQQADGPSPDALVRALAADQPPADAALALANLSARVATELQKLARAQAEAHRGQPEWGRWAKLANAARSGVLQAASCRDAARDLPRGDQPTTDTEARRR